MTDAIDTLFDALALPPGTLVDRRIPKSLLNEHGVASAADRREIDAGIERIDWRAACKPSTVGVVALADDQRDYLEIAVVTARLRGSALEKRAGRDRIETAIHRAIPYPVLLVIGSADEARLSIAPKRRHDREAGRVVVEEVVTSPPVGDGRDAVAQAFLRSLALSGIAAGDMRVLYEACRERIEALAAGRATGAYRLLGPPETAKRREGLLAHAVATREIERLTAAAARERALRKRIDLAHEIDKARAALAAATAALG